MIDLHIEGHIITIYRAAEELPIKRYAKFQKYNLIESGVGADMGAISNHFAKLFEFIGFKMQEEAVQEAKNLYYSFYMMLEEINVPGLAFACLVHSIDGEPFDDITEDALKKVVDRLNEVGVSQEVVVAQINDAKKKLLHELKLYCPVWFNDDSTATFYQNIKKKIAIVAKLVDDEDSEQSLRELVSVERFFAEYCAPACFDSDSANNAALQADSSFETLCAILESNGVTNAANLTTLQFYNRLEHFKKVNSAIRKAAK